MWSSLNNWYFCQTIKMPIGYWNYVLLKNRCAARFHRILSANLNGKGSRESPESRENYLTSPSVLLADGLAPWVHLDNCSRILVLFCLFFCHRYLDRFLCFWNNVHHSRRHELSIQFYSNDIQHQYSTPLCKSNGIIFLNLKIFKHWLFQISWKFGPFK